MKPVPDLDLTHQRCHVPHCDLWSDVAYCDRHRLYRVRIAFFAGVSVGFIIGVIVMLAK